MTLGGAGLAAANWGVSCAHLHFSFSQRLECFGNWGLEVVQKANMALMFLFLVVCPVEWFNLRTSRLPLMCIKRVSPLLKTKVALFGLALIPSQQEGFCSLAVLL